MPHQYYLRYKKVGHEWKATAYQNQIEVSVAFALTRDGAIKKLKNKMPKDKRFEITHGKTPNTRGTWVRVKDHQTGDIWEAAHPNFYSYFEALSEIEKELPIDYFFEKHPNSRMDAKNEWSNHHIFRSFFLPIIIMSAIVAIIMYFNGAFH